MSKAIVSVAVGSHYPRIQDRLKASLAGFDGDLHFWRDEWPPSSPPHSSQPYAFKLYAIHHASGAGADLVIWADAAIEFIKPPARLFEIIEQQGYMFYHLGWDCSQWSTDVSLPKLGVTRDEAQSMKMLCANFWGIDLRTPVAREIMTYMDARAQDDTFIGPWRNDPDADPASAMSSTPRGFCSKDARCLGHRHDQTALSVIVAKLGLTVFEAPTFFAYHDANNVPTPDVIALAKGA